MSRQRANSLLRKDDPAGARTQDLRIKRSGAESASYDAIETCGESSGRPCETVTPGASQRATRVVSPRGHQPSATSRPRIRPLWLDCPTPRDAA
jgi:hypothetical protein